jgi:trehalose 6-phosphate synthase
MERLLVISNRLPISMSRDENGAWKYQMSSGGLVSALSGLKKMMTFTWIGWPGNEGIGPNMLPVRGSTQRADVYRR